MSYRSTHLRIPCRGLEGGVWHGVGGAEPPDEPRDDAIDKVEARGAEQPK